MTMKKTSRRGFFGLLGAVAATAALDPERLLWVPGKKLISIPSIVRVPAILRDFNYFGGGVFSFTTGKMVSVGEEVAFTQLIGNAKLTIRGRVTDLSYSLEDGKPLVVRGRAYVPQNYGRC